MIHLRAVLIASALLATACAVGPNYHRPSAPVPAAYKEAATPPSAATGEWKPATPRDELHRGKWWEVFGEPELDALEEQVDVSNQNLAQADAQFRAARAAVRLARAGLFPSLDANPSVTRSEGTSRRAFGGTVGSTVPFTVYQLPLDFSWEADAFGRIRRSIEASAAQAQASAADVESVRLALQAELAVDYFTLRGLDAQIQLLDSNVAGYETALQLTKNRYGQGVVSGVDVAQAETQLETTRAQRTDLGVARAQTEHAVAVLIGKAPADFAMESGPIRVKPPDIPTGVPSELLERRPDIAAAERLAAAASAEIGVAQAAYFPTFTLAASGGFASSKLRNFFSLPNRFWSLGASALENLFDAGKRRAAKEQAVASYDAAVAGYRETVLGAFQEVEDNLAALRILEEEAKQQDAAVAAAEHSLQLAQNRYQGGITTYLEVVTAQTAALANERTEVDILTRRMVASVNLVKALGGGWRDTDLSSLDARTAPAPAGPRSGREKTR